MADPRKTRTHAADTAPGVGDGPAGAPPPPVDSKPGGRKAVWLIVGVFVVLVVVAFMTTMAERDDEGMVALGVAESEVVTAPQAAPGRGIQAPGEAAIGAYEGEPLTATPAPGGVGEGVFEGDAVIAEPGPALAGEEAEATGVKASR